MNIPRIVLAGLKGGSGKTILSLGLARAYRELKFSVKPYKKGPDYIDAGWLSRSAGQPTTNLDPFLMYESDLQALFWEKSCGADLALIEGNRGLFDGKDIDGSCSTAYLAEILDAPVILVVDCTKMTRTVAALIQGCIQFDPSLRLSGVIFNCTAGARHRHILTRCVQEYTDVEVLGYLPRLRPDPVPMRHMGLVSDREFDADNALGQLSQSVAETVDIHRIRDIAASAPPADSAPRLSWPSPVVEQTVRIGVVRDASLWFYYPENLEALSRAGADLVEVSLLRDSHWPELDGLYLGGGFPETQAESMSGNMEIKEHVLALSRSGLPIYAECGGLMYLCRELVLEGGIYPMVGLFSARVLVESKPQGHGYTRVEVARPNPFHTQGARFSGHEFHYSQCSLSAEDNPGHCFQMLRGTGLGQGRDGFLYRNTLACYTHLHALSAPDWAGNFVRACSVYRESRRLGRDCPDITV